MEKKLIGYKAPMDLFDGNIKKNELFTRENKMDNGYYPINEQGEDVFYLPKEIVETWEAIYEESFKEGDYIIWTEDYSAGNDYWFVKGDVVKINEIRDKIYILDHPKHETGGFENEGKFRLATPEEIEEYNSPKVGDYLVILDTGCNISGCGTIGSVKKLVEIKLVDRPYDFKYTYIFEDGSKCSSREGYTRKATLQEIEEYNIISIGEYPMGISHNKQIISFGCQDFSKEQLAEIRQLLSRPINPELKIEGTKITVELLDKILSKLK